jgi:uncharacterized protein (TIGR00369 family)
MPKGDGVDDQQQGARLVTPFQQMLGLRWSSDPGTDEVSVEMDLRPELCGPAGSLEGGVISTLVDVAGASCAVRVLKRLVATRDMSISFLAPARVGPVRARAVPLRAGRDSVVAEVRVTDVGNGSRLVAAALLTTTVLSKSTPIGNAPPAEGERDGA